MVKKKEIIMDYSKIYSVIMICIFCAINIMASVHQPWRHGNIYIIGDSNAAYCFSASEIYPKIGPLPEAAGCCQLRKPFEESYFNFKINHDESFVIPFIIHWVPGRTMYRIGRDGIDDFNIKLSYGVQESDVVVFTFGTIDLYMHMHRYMQQKIDFKQMMHRDIDEVIDTLAKNYVQTLQKNRENYKELGVVICACLPPVYHPIYEANFLSVWPDKLYLPTHVTLVSKLNERLAYYAEKNNFLFLNINHMFQGSEGELPALLTDGGHHINPKYNGPFKERLITLILKK
jgi:hypothetical protein